MSSKLEALKAKEDQGIIGHHQKLDKSRKDPT